MNEPASLQLSAAVGPASINTTTAVDPTPVYPVSVLPAGIRFDRLQSFDIIKEANPVEKADDSLK